MRHHNQNRKFGREAGQRKALLLSLARSLVLKGKIRTTQARAKEVRPYVEKLITRGKNPTLANHRLLISKFNGDEQAAKKTESRAQGYLERPGGYVRITKLPDRKSDGSAAAVIEFV